MKTDLSLSCSYMLKADFLLTWHNKKPKRLFAAVLQLDAYFGVCCNNTFYSRMLFLMDMLGMLITKKNKLFSMHFLRKLYT